MDMKALVKNFGFKLEQKAKEAYQNLAGEISINGQLILNQLTGFKEEYKRRLLYYYYCIWFVLFLIIIILLAILEKYTGILGFCRKIFKSLLSLCISFGSKLVKCCRHSKKDIV